MKKLKKEGSKKEKKSIEELRVLGKGELNSIRGGDKINSEKMEDQ